MFAFEPLNFKRHGRLRLAPSRSFHFARHLGMIDLLQNEIWRAAAFFPVVFVQSLDGAPKPPKPVVVLARAGQANGLVTRGGRWDHPFMPSMLTVYPFSFRQHDAEVKLLIDPLTDHLSPHRGVALFDGEGQPSDSLRKIIALMRVLSIQQQRIDKMCQVLQDFDLFDPIANRLESDLSVKLRYYHVSQDKLNQLKPSSCIVLRRQGWLPLLYAHAMSMQRDLNAKQPMVWARTDNHDGHP